VVNPVAGTAVGDGSGPGGLLVVVHAAVGEAVVQLAQQLVGQPAQRDLMSVPVARRLAASTKRVGIAESTFDRPDYWG
jgi:hypothetical protein